MTNKYALTKLSRPGWEKNYSDVLDLKAELGEWVCEICFSEFEDKYGEPPMSVLDMLTTACGAEFEFRNLEAERRITQEFYDAENKSD